MFDNADSLASAYGFAVNVTVLVTTAFCRTVSLEKWHWNPIKSAILVIDLLLLASNSLKTLHGGWFPLLFGACVYTALSTWKRGRTLLIAKLKADTPNAADFVASLQYADIQHVEGTAAYFAPATDVIPAAFLHNLKHNEVLHERVAFPWTQTLEAPHVTGPARAVLSDKRYGIHPARPARLSGCRGHPGIVCELRAVLRLRVPDERDFILSGAADPCVGTPQGSAPWREVLFAWLNRNAGRVGLFQDSAQPGGRVGHADRDLDLRRESLASFAWKHLDARGCVLTQWPMARLARTDLTRLATQLCALLSCRAAELRLAATPEGLVELRLQRHDQAQALALSTRIGTPEELQAWAAQAGKRPRPRHVVRASASPASSSSPKRHP
nr:KUP/HAK/KT family potassium transporter [Thiomonas sp. X19]